MEDNKQDIQISSNIMILPSFGKIPELKLELANIREAEARLIEAKTVNPSTYTSLEFTFNESYRDLKRHISAIGYQIALTEKAMEEAKSDVLLDKYPEFMKNKPKNQDNADMRKAFIIRDPEYVAALDRYNQLQAMLSNMDGKIKVMERVCAYMKLQINLLLRGGTGNSNYHVTGNRV